MSFENPTPLRLGMEGTFANVRYRVAGRVVVGCEIEGEIYYWNEFNLVSDDDDFVTLVHESTEDGEMWRLFTMFEPQSPMTVQQARAVKEGDRVNLEGNPIRVTLVDQSEVYFIEGEAQEGVGVGDIAHYFNAESANKMEVVSWTGDEVEYFRGVTIRSEIVAAAFGIEIESVVRVPPPVSGFSNQSESSSGSSALGSVLKAIVVLVILVCLAAFITSRSSRRSTSSWTITSPPIHSAPNEPTHAPIPPPPPLILGIGSHGLLDGTNYEVRGHAVVDISQVGLRHSRHEYLLATDDGNRGLLVNRGQNWQLFTPFTPATQLTPHQAAATHTGEKINLDGSEAIVSELFQSVVRSSDNPDLPGLKTGAVSFGFGAQAGPTLIQARWDESGISFHHGKMLATKDVAAAFAPTAPK